MQQFCQPVYALLVDEEVAAGRIRLPGYDDPSKRRAWLRAIWTGPAKGSMDEEKEARAARTRIEIGVSNEQMEAAAMTGEDRDAVYAQRLREINQRKADGTWVEPKDSNTPPAKSAQPAGERPGGEGDDAGKDAGDRADDIADEAAEQEETA